jgi:hypothetical protein
MGWAVNSLENVAMCSPHVLRETSVVASEIMDRHIPALKCLAEPVNAAAPNVGYDGSIVLCGTAIDRPNADTIPLLANLHSLGRLGDIWPAKAETANLDALLTLGFLPEQSADHSFNSVYEQAMATTRGQPVPVWDAAQRILSVDGQVVRKYRVPAPNQEVILAAFQEEGWPQRIDDPLSVRGDLEPRQRLNNTIKAINRHRLARVIRFLCDGTGKGVLWRSISNWQ